MSTTLTPPTVRQSFSPADYAALEAAHVVFRDRAVCLTLVDDYPGLPTVAEVSWPASPTEARWIIYRDAAGVVLAGLNLGDDAARFPSVQAAVDAISGALDADHQAAVEAIPGSLQRR